MKGPAFARNRGAEVSKGEILLFIDSDVTLHTNTIGLIKGFFNENKSTNAVIGSYDDSPGSDALVSKYRNLLHHFTHQKSQENISTFWGACGAIKREAFVRVKGFDERYVKPSIEDIELGYRLRQHGYGIKLDKNIQVKHLKTWTFWKMINTDIFQRAKPWTQLLFKKRKWRNKELNLNTQDRLAVTLASLALLCSLLSVLSIIFIWLAIPIYICLLLTNLRLYRFFFLHFRVAIPLIIILHWVYLLSSSFGLVFGAFTHYLKRY